MNRVKTFHFRRSPSTACRPSRTAGGFFPPAVAKISGESDFSRKRRSVPCEAVRQSVATGCYTRSAGATAARSHVTGCDAFQESAGGSVLSPTPAIGMSHHRGTFGAARPVLAGHVLVRWKRGSIGLRTVRMSWRFGVSPRPLMTSPFSDSAVLVRVIGAVQFRHILGDCHALGVDPRPSADAVARVHSASALRRRDKHAGLAARPCRGGEFRTVCIRAGEAAEVGALAGAFAGDKGHAASAVPQRARTRRMS